MKKPEAGPLKKALADVKKTESDISDAKKQQIAVQKEVDDYLAGVDPNDAPAIKIVSAKKTMLETFPCFIERAEQRLEALVPDLEGECERFADDLAILGCEENEELGKIYDERVAMFFKPGTRGACSVCPAITSIPINSGMIGERQISQNNLLSYRLIAATRRAEELLEIHATLEAYGFRWRPWIWKALGKK